MKTVAVLLAIIALVAAVNCPWNGNVECLTWDTTCFTCDPAAEGNVAVFSSGTFTIPAASTIYGLSISGGSVTLGSSSNIQSGLTITGGTFNTGGFDTTLSGNSQWTAGTINIADCDLRLEGYVWVNRTQVLAEDGYCLDVYGNVILQENAWFYSQAGLEIQGAEGSSTTFTCGAVTFMQGAVAIFNNTQNFYCDGPVYVNGTNVFITFYTNDYTYTSGCAFTYHNGGQASLRFAGTGSISTVTFPVTYLNTITGTVSVNSGGVLNAANGIQLSSSDINNNGVLSIPAGASSGISALGNSDIYFHQESTTAVGAAQGIVFDSSSGSLNMYGGALSTTVLTLVEDLPVTWYALNNNIQSLVASGAVNLNNATLSVSLYNVTLGQDEGVTIFQCNPCSGTFKSLNVDFYDYNSPALGRRLLQSDGNYTVAYYSNHVRLYNGNPPLTFTTTGSATTTGATTSSSSSSSGTSTTAAPPAAAATSTAPAALVVALVAVALAVFA